MKVYLCGPINGCTDEQCKDWRKQASLRFSCIDPMVRDYRGREDDCVKEIVEFDKLDIENSDVLLVNFDKPSVGTSMEVFYAWTLNKPVVLVAKKDMKISPWMIYHATYIFNDFESAYAKIQELENQEKFITKTFMTRL